MVIVEELKTLCICYYNDDGSRTLARELTRAWYRVNPLPLKIGLRLKSYEIFNCLNQSLIESCTNTEIL